MFVEIPYGTDKVNFEVSDSHDISVISPSDISPSPNPVLEVTESLNNLVGSPPIKDLHLRGKTVAIAVDDITRLTPIKIVLPPLLKILEEEGVERRHIKIIIALGTHREMNAGEMQEKYGAEVVEDYEVINHSFKNESELNYLGLIEGDIPVWINREFLKSDIRIVIGNLIPHFNAGWGAGAKILLPGLAGEETVGSMHVHSATTTPNGLGMDNNPTRRLIDTFAQKVGIHLVINTAITRQRDLVKAFSGHYIKAHRKGIELAKKIYSVESPGPADITVSSSYPADIEFWQGLKGLFSADLATKQGGGILELTPCPEGVSVAHPKWIDYLQYERKELREMYKKGEIEDLVALGLALNVAYVRERHKICLVSDGISQKDADKMRFEKFKGIVEGMEFLTKLHGARSKVNILTHGGETYPITGDPQSARAKLPDK